MNTEPPHRILLSSEPAFRLGGWAVEPALRQMSNAGESRTIEPRVMQVLVALAKAKDRVIGRDALVDSCWSGRIVGETAINRVISLLRTLGAETDAFEIETITKVGYRLKAAEAASPEPMAKAEPDAIQSSWWASRRAIFGAAVGAVVAAAGGSAWWVASRRKPSAEAVRLTDHAMSSFVEYRGADLNPQILADLREAVRIAPDYATAWGGLALVFAGRYEVAPRAQRPDLAARVRSAAARALALDPKEPRASMALLGLSTAFGRWADYETQARSLLEPTHRHPIVVGSLGGVLQDVGRWRESAPLYDEVDHDLLTNPIGHCRYVMALWGSGQFDAAELAVADAVQRFPRHPATWSAQIRILMYGGEPDEAIRRAQDSNSRPPETTAGELVPLIAAAGAIRSGSTADAKAAIQLNLQALPAIRDVFGVTHRLAALGAKEDAFSILEGYFFRRGPWSGISPDQDRGEGGFWTPPLFEPPMRPLWQDRRFTNLTRRLGLNAYWDRTNSRPDFLGLI